MRVWIDLANSPHPLLFAPVARRLEAEGAEVLVTARDNAQTLELARQRWETVTAIGGESPNGRLPKARTMLDRVRELVGWARRNRPDVALSHNSYGQAIAARVLRLPVVTAMDFEHQPANHLAFRAADRILLPEAIPLQSVRRQGASRRKVTRYPGLKEELYLADFAPDGSVLEALGIERTNGDALVVARTPPARAAYHRFGNPLFDECLRVLARQADVRTVVLPRHEEQRRALASLSGDNVVVPRETVDTRSLLREADLMVGAGGTMTREAALMGIPTYSVYAGSRPAVDRWLEGRGRLRTLTRAETLFEVPRRERPAAPLDELRARAAAIEDAFVEATVEAPGRGLR
jgi:predicted glycosyltransferase